MVERDLAKVEVASSTLVSRSKTSEATQAISAGVASIVLNPIGVQAVVTSNQTAVPVLFPDFTTLMGAPAA